MYNFQLCIVNARPKAFFVRVLTSSCVQKRIYKRRKVSVCELVCRKKKYIIYIIALCHSQVQRLVADMLNVAYTQTYCSLFVNFFSWIEL